ncbi:MAG: diguanylate cyclase [Butyrivibrio sp.]|nr:diguanylate cyclase [Butyrivibrio sp.]
MKNNPFKWLTAVLIIAAVTLSSLVYVLTGMNSEEEKNRRILMAEMVDKAVLSELSKPITVSRMISNDATLKNLLMQEYLHTEEDTINEMRDYLSAVQKEFRFTSVYVISDMTKNYYTYIGLNKVIDPENDSFDSWYTNFLSTGKDYELESSTDQVNRDKLTIFVDGRVEDDKGFLLGVSGVGIETEEVQKLLARYRLEYNIRVDYISEDGLVQMSSQPDSVHNSYVKGIDLTEVNSESFNYYGSGIDAFTIVRFVPEIGWYLVIRSNSIYSSSGFDYRFFFAQALILVTLLAILIIGAKSFNAESGLVNDKRLEVDYLTGLPNREYFLRIYGEKGTLYTTKYHSIAEFSIDDFDGIDKMITAERIILSVVRNAREAFGKQSQIIRWNKNAFVVLMEIPVEEADSLCRDFCRAVEKVGEVTVSVGLTNIELDETLKKNYYRAVQNMYLVKELGGNNVKKG